MDEMQAIFTLFEKVPRQGPGLTSTTLEALSMLPDLPEAPRVLDVGAGSAAAARVLAKKLGVVVEASDIHEPFLAAGRVRAQKEGVSELLRTRVADMLDPGVPESSVDLLWSEGAVYIAGLGEGLRAWRRIVKAGGYVVVSHITWLSDDPPEEIRAFWQQAYPDISDAAANDAVAVASGYEVLDHLTVPRAAWTEFYAHVIPAIRALRPEAAGDPVFTKVLDEEESQADLYERFGEHYGYVFYLLRKV